MNNPSNPQEPIHLHSLRKKHQFRPVGTFLGVDVTVTANGEAMGGWLHFDGRNLGDGTEQ